MHLYFASRGVQQQRDVFKTFMQTQMFKFKRKNLKTGKQEVVQVQGALRPVELWEYVFPEECKDEVLTMLGVEEDGTRGYKGFINDTKLFALRKALGAEKLGKYKKVLTNRFVETRGMAIHPIGIKKDKKGSIKDYDGISYEQELL